jgi:hypothetical protein
MMGQRPVADPALCGPDDRAHGGIQVRACRDEMFDIQFQGKANRPGFHPEVERK